MLKNLIFKRTVGSGSCITSLLDVEERSCRRVGTTWMRLGRRHPLDKGPAHSSPAPSQVIVPSNVGHSEYLNYEGSAQSEVMTQGKSTAGNERQAGLPSPRGRTARVWAL